MPALRHRYCGRSRKPTGASPAMTGNRVTETSSRLESSFTPGLPPTPPPSALRLDRSPVSSKYVVVFEEEVPWVATQARRGMRSSAAWRVPTRPTAVRSGWTRVTRRACVGLSPPVNRADKCKRAVRHMAVSRAVPGADRGTNDAQPRACLCRGPSERRSPHWWRRGPRHVRRRTKTA